MQSQAGSVSRLVLNIVGGRASDAAEGKCAPSGKYAPATTRGRTPVVCLGRPSTPIEG